jgi:hypothetical protein
MLGFADLFAAAAAPPAREPAAAATAAATTTPATAPLSPLAPPLALLLVALVWAYLWFAAGSEAGTLSRWAWYAAALAQGWLALLALRAEAEQRRAAAAEGGAAAGAKRFAMSGTGSLLALLLGAPLLHATLFELLLHDADRGGLYTQPTAWVGRAVAVAGVLAAGALLVRQARRRRL